MALDITKIKAALPVEEDKGENVSSIVDGVFAVNTGSTSNQDQEESTKPGSNKSSGFWDTWVGDAIERLNTGGAQLGSGLFGTLDKATIGLEKLGLGTRGGAFKDASNYFKNVAESSRANSVRNDGKSYSELWKEGDYAGAVGDIALQGVESLPMSISAAAATVAGAPVAGLAGIGAITASDKYDQLDTENPDMGEFAKASNAILTGTAEGLSEMLGAGVSKVWMKTLYKSLGRDKAEQAVKKGLMGQLQRHYKEFGMFYEPVEEGIEEVASQLAENITDKITGADPNRDITDGLQDSFVYGMGGGAYFSAAGVPGFAKRQYDKIKTRKDYNNAKSTFEEEFKDDDRMLDIGSELESATPEEKVAFLEALEPSNQFAKSQKEALFNLVRSDLAYKSLRTPEAINEEKSERRELAVQTEMMNYDNAIAPITAENGMIQQVYINGDKEAPVYITKGSIVASRNENGEFLFDPDKSDQSLYYKDAEGNMQVVSPSQVTGVASLNRLEDSRARYEADIRAQLDMQDQMAEEQRRQEEAQEISNGDDVTYIDPDTGKQLKGKVADIMPGSEYLSIDIGDGNLSTVPKNITIKSAIQTEPLEGEILDKTSEKSPVNEVISQEDESKTSEIIDPEPVFADVAEVQEQEPEPVLPVTEKSPIVMREDGTPDFIASGEGNTLDFLLEKYKDKSPHKVEVTKNALESDLKKASAALDKALQNYDNAPIGKEDKAESALLQAQQAYDALKQEADFWINLDKTIKESNIKPGDQIANGIREAGDPMSGEELAAMMLANGSIRLTRDSYERETGSGKEEGKKMFGLFASSTNGGVNIERAGELLMLADLENGTNFFDQNDPNAGRNAIIEVLSSARTRGDLIDYVKSNRETMAERERQAEYNDYAQWCEENYHLAPEEYEAYESDMRARAESINQNDIDYIDGQIADEIQQRNEELREIDAILAMQNENGNESDKRNDEGGTGGLPEGSDQLLQDEQSVQVGRTGEAEAEYQGANDSVNIQNGVAQESAPERIKSVSEIANAETAFDMMDRVGLEQKTKLVISEAEQQVDINPTEAQKEAGNYKKGHVKIDGHDITIEQPAGSIRSGKDADGKEWSVTMNNTYGYIRGTEGVDGDHIDIFLSDSPASGNVYVVDQVNGDGAFDEHKVMYGFNSEEEAKAAYLANYSPGWSGIGDIAGVSKEEFKKWIGSSKRKTKPFADYKIAQHEKEDKGIRFRKSNSVSEEESIIERSKADGTYMKAPNGKPTNLNEKQWIQVRSKAFKKWFGDWENDPQKSSKVVDKNGEPLVVYHGTLTNGLTKFKKEFVGSRYSYDEKGFFFISNEKIAQDYAVSEYDSTRKGEVVPVFINLRNPLVADAKWCKKNGLGSRVFEDNDVIEFWDNYQSLMIEESDSKDGVIVTDGKYNVIVAFESNQIKSAIDNNGNYSFFDDDIRFRRAEESYVDPNIDETNRKFNEELQRYQHGEMGNNEMFHLGTPQGAMLSFIPKLPIVMRQKAVRKGIEKKHNVDINTLLDMPSKISSPIFVFQRSGNTIGVLTEMKDRDGKNVCVAIEMSKSIQDGGKVLEVNDVRSFHGREIQNIISPIINNGTLRWVDKEKALDWFSSASQPAQQEITNEELSSATKIVKSFVNPTVEEGKITSAVDELTGNLNTPVQVIRNVGAITDNDSVQQNKKRGSKGWYDPVTGKVYLVLPNAESVADAQATVLHEVVAHKGLRGLLGDSFSSTMEGVFDSLSQETQDSLLDDFGDKAVAAEEYCAHMAETMSDPGIIQKICSAIKDTLRKIGVDLKMTDGDIMYMLWKSKNRLEDGDTAMESMSKISHDQNVKKQAKEYDALFRSGNPIEKLPVSAEKKIDIVNDLQSRTERLYEGYVDRMIAVKKLQDLIAEKTGKPIPDYMNVWMYENTLSSRNTYEISKLKEKHLNPLTASLKRLVEAGLNERDMDTYVIAKHGLERNEYMHMKAVREYVDNLKEDDIKEGLYSQIEGRTFSEIVSIADDNLQDLVAKLSNKDYSGLTAIQKELGDQSIEEFISEIESEFKTEINDLWKRIKAVNEFSLKKWFDSGMINRATYEKVKGMYKNYVPLRGFDETMAHDVYEYYTGDGSPFNNPLKTAEGRTSRAESPFPHLTSMAESSIVGGNKNLMKLHLYRLAQYDMASENPTGKLSITKQWYVYDGVDKDGVEKWKPSTPEYSDDVEQYRKNIEKHAEEMALLESERKATRNPSKLKVAYILLPAEANEHAIGVKLNGEFYQVLVHGNPKVAQAVEGLNDEARTNNKFVKAVAWANRQMAANFTTRNPAFVASNLTRDLIWSTTALSVKEGGKYRNRFMRNIPKASGALIRKLNGKQDLSNPIDIMLNEFLENGGRTGYTALYSVEKYKKDIQNSIKTGKWAKTKRGYNAVLDFMQLPNEWAEDLSRFSTYMTSREEGRTILKSVADAKEVTVNFNRKGSGKYGAGVFRGLFLFFNAAVQSLNNAYGLTLKNPAGMATALGGFSIAGAMVPLILSMLGSDDEREKYNGLPDYVRKNNLCIPLGWCGVDGFLKVPLPIELRAFYGIGDAVYRGCTGEDEWTDALCNTVMGLLDLLPLNPAGGTSNFTPAVVKPIVESYVTNKDFTGKPIAKITPFNEYDPEYQKVYRNTSVISVTVSEYLNMLAGGGEAIRKFETYKTLSGSDLLNPASTEHLFEAYFGGMFTTLNQSFKTFVGVPTGLNDFSWRNFPVLNRFYDTGEVDGTMMKVNEKYFDYLGEMKEAQNVYRKYESLADTSPALESVKYLDELSKYEEGKDWKRAEFIADYAERINDYMDEIKESTDEKRKDELQKEINLLKKEMVESLKNGRVPD